MVPPTVQRGFSELLYEQLARQNVSQRELARRLNPKAPEIARRALRKWLKGTHLPVRANRVLVAEALGLELDHFERRLQEVAA